MKNLVHINMSLLVHILLDAEGNGRWGVQGNTFANTTGYLKQYVEQLPKDSEGCPQISGLAYQQLDILSDALIELAKHQQEQETIGLKTAYSADVDSLVKQTSQDILQLSSNKNYFLPGGWKNSAGFGHAMIYQFRKIPATENTPEIIRFSLYNSGDGLKHHEKQSQITHEAYFPVQTYDIPTKNLNLTEFELFIGKLIIPNFPYYNQRKFYNADRLYQDIQQSMPFLNVGEALDEKARLVTASEIFSDGLQDITTAGQLSGTCAQRSIHQMLKVNFDSLPHYQNFIFRFALYALKDFIYQPTQDAPQKHSEGIIHLLELGIDNLLKILQEPNVFTKDEQNSFQTELSQLREKISRLILKPNDATSSKTTTEQQDNSSKKICEHLPVVDFSTTAPAFSALPKQAKLPLFDNAQTLLHDLQILLQRCEISSRSNPPDVLWVINNIEQVINTLPLTLYNTITAEQLDQIEAVLAQLQTLYLETMKQCAGEGVYPDLHVTQCSFLALRDYCMKQYAAKKLTDPHLMPNIRNPSHYLHHLFLCYLNNVEHSPFYATNNPSFDQRLIELRKAYSIPVKKPGFFEPTTAPGSESSESFDLLDLYKSLLDSEPACQKFFENLYTENPAHDDGSNNCLNVLLNKGKLTALYALFEYLFQHSDEMGQISRIPKNENIDFSFLFMKIQLAIRMEKTLHDTFSPLMNSPIQKTGIFLLIDKSETDPCGLRFISYSNGYKQNTYEKNNHLLGKGHINNAYLGTNTKNMTSFPNNAYRPNPSNPNNRGDLIRGASLHNSHDELSICAHKYKLDKREPDCSFVQNALLVNDSGQLAPIIKISSRSANEIQIRSFEENKGRLLSKQIHFKRELQHLRLSPQHQIILTLNYFIREMHHLSNFGYQTYVEANLFEPGLLNALFADKSSNKRESFLSLFDSFTQKGFDTFDDLTKNITVESLFFIRLRCSIHQYMLQHAILFKDQGLQQEAERRLHQDNVLMSEQINRHTSLSLENQKSNSILGSLHRYRFLTLMALTTNTGPISQESLEQLLESYFYAQSYENTINPEDKSFQLQWQKVARAFQSTLQQIDKTLLEKSLENNIIKILGVNASDKEPDNWEITGIYPHYTLRAKKTGITCDLQVEQGKIFKEGRALTCVPLAFKNHAVLKRLGIEKATTCFLSTDSQTVEFYPIGLRLKKEVSAAGDIIHTIQKQWKIKGKTEWYELQPLTEKKHRQISSFAHFHLRHATLDVPDSLKGGDSDYWVNIVNTNKGFMTRNNRPIYAVKLNPQKKTASYKNIEHTNPQYYLENVNHKNSAYYHALSSLDPLIEMNFTHPLWGRTKGIAYLPRYGISFELDNKVITLKNTSYALNLEDLNNPINLLPFKKNIAQLTLTDEKTKAQLCIVPVQQFYFDKKEQVQGEEVHLTHDISQHIVTDKLINGIGSQEQWHYEKTEDSIQFRLVEGKPKPNNAADALYLCYLYLGSHETEKAWDLLENIRRYFPLEGSYRELTFLSWIIQALPAMSHDKNHPTDDQAVLGSPRHVVCQLKALALYTNFLSQGKTQRFPEQKILDTTTANGQCEERNREMVRKFYDTLPKIVDKKYTQLLITRDHLSVSYTLHDEECKSLLRYHHKFSDIKGTLGYEYKRLSLKTLLLERAHLKALITKQESAGYTLKEDLKKRLSTLENEISAQKTVMQRETKLEVKAIQIPLPQYILPWDMLLRPTPPTEPEQQSAIACLLSTIDVKIFKPHMPAYMWIAANADSNPHYGVLRQFCVNYLMAEAKRLEIPSNEDKKILNYVRALYYIMHKPECINNEENLLNELKDAQVKPIYVRQARDVFEKPLKETREIIAELLEEPEIKCHTSSKKTSDLFKGEIRTALPTLRDFFKTSFPDNDDPFNLFCAEYKNIEEQYQAQLTQSDITEELAGEYQYICIQKQRELAGNVLKSPELRKKLESVALAEIQQMTTILDAENGLWEQILLSINTQLKKNYQINIDAKQRSLLSKEDLLVLYFEVESCHQLRQEIHQCMLLEVQRQQANRFLKAIRQLPHNPDNIQLAHVANILMTENLVDAANDPVMMLFQYQEDLLLHPQQIKALKNLFSTSPDDPHAFNQLVEKIIMGGGKSKVLLPLLAQKKATGLNLVIIELPDGLIDTNHPDLNGFSQRLFRQTGHRFDFNRDSDCSPKRLEEIYQQCRDVSVYRQYLVTTGESMQSLQLKYLELLLLPFPSEAKERKTRAEQITWLSQITAFIQERGDTIIDEVHQGLLFKKKLNYAIGLPTAIDPIIIKHTLDLYRFLAQLSPGFSLDNLLNISRNKEFWIQQLLEHPESPLKTMMEKLAVSLKTKYSPGHISDELMAYLREEHIPDFLTTADPLIQDALAFYKEQCRLLPQTLDRRYKEHYGPSQDEQKNYLARLVSIPYVASNKSREHSQFGNPLEIVNYSTQALLIEGLSIELLSALITNWQNDAHFEWQHNAHYQSLDETPTAQKFIKTLNKDHRSTFQSLKEIDVKNTEKMALLLDTVRYQPEFLFQALEKCILPQVTVEPSILHSDSMNHVSLYNSVQAVSGTPFNYMTFHQNLLYDPTTSLGTDGYVQQILKKKNTAVHSVDFTDLKTYLVDLYKVSQKKKETRAIIDICATFRGKTNRDVAKALADSPFCQSNSIKYVLYFETIKEQGLTRHVLHAYDIAQKQSIQLKNSRPDEINQTLNCTPEERFSFYSQAETEGLDLQQAFQANGLCLVDDKTQDFSQGAFRMRKLAEQQTVEIIVPKKMAGLTLDNLINQVSNNKEKNLKEVNFYATLAKMNNVLRQQVLQKIAQIDHNNADQKSSLTKKFKAYLVEPSMTNLWEQYGQLYHEEKTEEIFKEHANKLIKDWLLCVGAENTDAAQLKQLDSTMQDIITKALPFCHEKSLKSQHNNTGQEVQTQQEKQQEQQKEQIKEEEEQRFDASLQSSQYYPWSLSKLRELSGFTAPLNKNCLSDEMTLPSLFSENLAASDNYRRVATTVKNVLSPLVKPTHATLFQEKRDPITNRSVITACLISNQELEEITNILNKNVLANTWIETIEGDVLAGIRPDTIDDENNQHYNALVEQVLFFNGQCKALINRKKPLYWLSHDTQNKLDYLEKCILPYRETTLSDLNFLKMKFKEKNDALIYIHTHKDNDLTQFDWRQRFPELLEIDIPTLKQVAQAYKQINETLTYDSVDGLTEEAREQVKQYCEHKKSHPTTGIGEKMANNKSVFFELPINSGKPLSNHAHVTKLKKPDSSSKVAFSNN